jgi:hypothetical protein
LISGPGLAPGLGGRRDGQTSGEILPARAYHRVEKVKVWITPGISSFYIGGPSSSAWTGGVISGMRCLVPQPFLIVGSRSYLEFWAITGDTRYMRY